MKSGGNIRVGSGNGDDPMITPEPGAREDTSSQATTETGQAGAVDRPSDGYMDARSSGFLERPTGRVQNLYLKLFDPQQLTPPDYSTYETLKTAGGASLRYKLVENDDAIFWLLIGNRYDVASFIFHEIDEPFFRAEGSRQASIDYYGYHPSIADSSFQMTYAQEPLSRGPFAYRARYNPSTQMTELLLVPTRQGAPGHSARGSAKRYWELALEDFGLMDVRELEEKATGQTGDFKFSDIHAAFDRMLSVSGEPQAHALANILRDPEYLLLFDSFEYANYPEVEAGLRLNAGGLIDAIILRFIERNAEGGVIRTLNVSEWIGKPSEDGTRIDWKYTNSDPKHSRPVTYSRIIDDVFKKHLSHSWRLAGADKLERTSYKDYSGFETVEAANHSRLFHAPYKDDLNGTEGIVVAGELHDVASFIYMMMNELGSGDVVGENGWLSLGQLTTDLNRAKNPSDDPLGAIRIGRGIYYEQRFNPDTNMFEAVIRTADPWQREMERDISGNVTVADVNWKEYLTKFGKKNVRDLGEWIRGINADIGSSDIRAALDRMLDKMGRPYAGRFAKLLSDDPKRAGSQGFELDKNTFTFDAGLRFGPGEESVVFNFYEWDVKGRKRARDEEEKEHVDLMHVVNVVTWAGAPSANGRHIRWDVSATNPDRGDPMLFRQIILNIFADDIVHEINVNGAPQGSASPASTGSPAPDSAPPATPTSSGGSEAKGAGVGGFVDSGEKTGANSDVGFIPTDLLADQTSAIQDFGLSGPLVGAQTAMHGATNTVPLGSHPTIR